MIPIRDETRSQTTPHITRILLMVNVIVFFVAILPDFLRGNWFYALFGDSLSLNGAILTYGMVPNNVLRGQRLYTLFTSMFMHADLLHLGGNMLFLYIFGDNVEDAFGHSRYILFYLLSGIAASMVHLVSVVYAADLSGLIYPAIGASGAIAGVLGAYLVMYPTAKILTLVLIGWAVIVPVPAILFLGLWFVYQMLYGMLALGLEVVTGVAYWAHIGGFVAGLFFGVVWRSRRRTSVT